MSGDRFRRWFSVPSPVVDDRRGVLASRVPGVFFQAESTIWLDGQENDPSPVADLVAVAGFTMWKMAGRVAETRSVLDREAAEDEINTYAQLPLEVLDRGTTAVGRFRLTVLPSAVKVSERFHEAEAEGAVESLRYQWQLRRAEDIRATILSDPGLARAWWIDGRPERLESLDRMDRILQPSKRSSPEETDRGGSESIGPVPRIVSDFLVSIDDQQRTHLVRVLENLLTSFGRGDLTQELRTELDRDDPDPDGGQVQ